MYTYTSKVFYAKLESVNLNKMGEKDWRVIQVRDYFSDEYGFGYWVLFEKEIKNLNKTKCFKKKNQEKKG